MIFALITLGLAAVSLLFLMIWVSLDPEVKALKRKKHRRFKAVVVGTGQQDPHIAPKTVSQAGTTDINL